VPKLISIVKKMHLVSGTSFRAEAGACSPSKAGKREGCAKYTFGITHVWGEVMTAIHETAYPRIRSHLSDKDLNALYTPTPDDLAFIARSTTSSVAAFGGMVL
jgi:hypothetical protein